MQSLDRERKDLAHEVIGNIAVALRTVNGPFNEMTATHKAIQEAYDAIIEDEVVGACEHCEENIWLEDEGHSTSEDGVMICAECCNKINDATNRY